MKQKGEWLQLYASSEFPYVYRKTQTTLKQISARHLLNELLVFCIR